MRKWLICLFSIGMLQAGAQTIPEWKIQDLDAYIRQPGSKVRIVNIWATFCKPCIEEIPGFMRVHEELKAQTELLLVSVDLKQMYPNKLEKFVSKRGYSVPVVWLNETNADYFCPFVDPNWSGSIPATLIVNPSTGYRKFFEAEMTEQELKREVQAVLAP